MTHQDYVNLIAGLFKTAGVTGTPDAAVNHLSVAGSTIGLIYDESQAPNTVFVFVDLGNPNRADLDHRLLLSNAAIAGESAGFGHFARWEDTGSVIYRAALPVTPKTTPNELGQAISAFKAAAHERFQQVSS